MPTRTIKSVKGHTIRLTKLDPCGTPLDIPDVCRTVITGGFVSVTLLGDYFDGPAYQSRNIWGDLCINDKDPGQLVRATATISLCDVNPDVLDLLSDGQPLISEGEAIGASWDTSRNWSGVSLEVWTKALGDGCDQWGYMVIPFLRGMRLSQDLVIAQQALTVTVAADALPSTGWVNGPYGDDPLRVPLPDGSVFGMVVTDVPPPAGSDLSLCPDRLLPGASFWIDACESLTVSGA
jgi:hypothetical protein